MNTPADHARLQAALEDRMQGRTAPDLTDSILAAAGMDAAPPPRRLRRWLVAALVILGISIIPAVQWLQHANEGTKSATTDDTAPRPQDPVAPDTPSESIEPADLTEFVGLMQGVEAVSARVTTTDGGQLPGMVPGESEIPLVRFLGKDARRELGWSTSLPDEDAETLRLLGEAQGPGAGWEPIEPGGAGPGTNSGPMRTMDLRMHLADGRAIDAQVSIDPTATRQARLELQTGSLRLTNKNPQLFHRVAALVQFAERTLQADRGIFRGDQLTPSPALVKRVDRLRLHDATLTQFQAIGGSTVCKILDVRFSPALQGQAFGEALLLFPNLRAIVYPDTMERDPFGGTPLPSIEQVIVCGEDVDPFGASPELRNGSYRGQTMLMEMRARAIGGPPTHFLRGNGHEPVLRAFPNLQRVIIPGAALTEGDLDALPDSIQDLVLRFPRRDGLRAFSDAALAKLTKLPELRHLDLSFARTNLTNMTPNSGPGMETLRALSGASGLDTLILDGWFDRATTDSPDDPKARREALAKLMTLPHLKHLSLQQCPDLAPADLEAFRTAPNLRVLDLRGCAGLPINSLTALANDLPRCELRPSPRGPYVSMRPVADPSYQADGVAFDLVDEAKRLEQWLSKNDNRTKVGNDPKALDRFHELAPEAGGPAAGAHLRWCTFWLQHPTQQYRQVDVALPEPITVRSDSDPATGWHKTHQLVPINMHHRGFTQMDFIHAEIVASDDLNGVRVDYRLAPGRAKAYADFTAGLLREPLPILWGNEILSAPIIQGAIPAGRGALQGLPPDLAMRILSAVNGR